MSNEILGDRRVALEEAFFAKHNRALQQKLRDADEARSKKNALSAATGITDEVVIDMLAKLNIGSDTVAALSLVPLVAVAWADGNIDDKERGVAFSKAAEAGLHKRDISYQLLEQWFKEKPSSDLLFAWKAYVRALSMTLSHEARQTLKAEVLGRARTVANAAGGFMGIGRKVSLQEANALTDLEAAFGD